MSSVMTVGGYPVADGYMGYDSILGKYRLFDTEGDYMEYIEEKEKEYSNEN